jgi:putative NADH-flavin reductase
MRIAVLGAHGATGLQLTRQALDAGHVVVAASRRPAEFPLHHPALSVVGTDAYDAAAVARVVEGADAVLSTLGVPFTRRPVTIYSEGTAHLVEAMRRHGVRRLAVVSSAATDPRPHAEGGFLLNRVMQPLITATLGRTTYADMRRMEALVEESGLEWTIVRPSGLFDADRVSAYRLEEDHADGVFTSRPDLAACLLAQATDPTWIGRRVAVTTAEGAPTLLQMIRREAFASR